MADTNVPIVGIVVPQLTDNSTWFVNVAAWNAYWLATTFSANIPVADSGTYGLIKKAATAVYTDPGTIPTNRVTLQIDTDGDGVTENYEFVTAACFDSLKAQFDALNAAVKDMRTQLKATSVITNAQ